jgi:hypothetical protein
LDFKPPLAAFGRREALYFAKPLVKLEKTESVKSQGQRCDSTDIKLRWCNGGGGGGGDDDDVVVSGGRGSGLGGDRGSDGDSDGGNHDGGCEWETTKIER